MIITKICEECGEFKGYFTANDNPSQATIVYCRCQPEGWEPCIRHSNNIRRRHRSCVFTDSNGDHAYFSWISMIAPCSDERCFTPSADIYEQVEDLFVKRSLFSSTE